METFEVGREEKCGAVEFGKGVWCFDDGVAKAFENGVVERVEDGVLKDGVVNVVFLACGSGLAWGGRGYCILHSGVDT